MKEFQGIDIREVWDWRLSRGNPIIYNSGPTWVVRIYDNNPGGKGRVLLAEHDTGIPTSYSGGTKNPHDREALAVCYEWLHSVRDKYARDHIEERKPLVAMINAANRAAVDLNTAASAAEAAGDRLAADRLRGEMAAHIARSNDEIKRASADLAMRIAGGAK